MHTLIIVKFWWQIRHLYLAGIVSMGVSRFSWSSRDLVAVEGVGGTWCSILLGLLWWDGSLWVFISWLWRMSPSLVDLKVWGVLLVSPLFELFPVPLLGVFLLGWSLIPCRCVRIALTAAQQSVWLVVILFSLLTVGFLWSSLFCCGFGALSL